MKNKSIWKVIGICIAFTILLTWVIPSATVGSEGITVGSILPTGFADIFTSIDVIAYYFIRPSVFILFVGMFYAVINKTGAFKAFVDKATSMFKGKKEVFLILTILFYSLITALTGIYLPLIMFVPLSMAILTALKYNKMQMVLATVGASTIGLLAELSNQMITSLLGAETNSYLWVKLVLLIVLIVVISVYVLKINAKKEKVEKEEIVDEKIIFLPTKRDASVNSKVKGKALLIVLSLMLIVFILGLTPWKDNSVFSNLYSTIKDIKIGEFAPFSAILGSFEVFGEWTYLSLYPTIALAIIILSIANSLKFGELVDACVSGIKRVLGLACMAALINVVVVFTLNSGFMGTIINLLSKGGNIALITLSSLISSPFMVDMTYASQYVLNMIYSATLSDSIPEIWGLIMQVTYSFTMLIAPTSVALMVALGYVEESYSKWVKYIWKLLLVIFIICLIAISVAYML